MAHRAEGWSLTVTGVISSQIPGPDSRIALFTAFFGLIGLLSGVAVASHSFTDVPDLHTFHEDITWLRDNNIRL